MGGPRLERTYRGDVLHVLAVQPGTEDGAGAALGCWRLLDRGDAQRAVAGLVHDADGRPEANFDGVDGLHNIYCEVAKL